MVSFYRLVTPYSKLHFRVLNHSSLMKDGLLGEGTIDLYKILAKQDGKRKFRLDYLLDIFDLIK